MNLMDIYKILHVKAIEYTVFSSTHGTFSGIDNMVGHRESHNKFKKIGIVSSILQITTV